MFYEYQNQDKYVKLFLLLASILILSMIGIQESFAEENSIPTQRNMSFNLQIHQTAFFESENIQVVLSDIEDSRCPSNQTIQCVWEGQVTTNVIVTVGENNLGNFVLGTVAHFNPSIQQFDKYFLQLIKVEPYPTSTEPISPSNYVVTMKLISTENLPPLKQVNNGILPANIICKQVLTLVFKSTDGSPACVKPSTAEKLVERGWDIKKSIDEQLIAEGFGIISGSVRIGPLCPIEPCMIEIDPYSSRQLILTNEKGNVVLVNLKSDGSFSEIIPVGDYSVSLSDCDFFGCRFAVPQETTIVSGKTVFIELDIDTGIR